MQTAGKRDAATRKTVMRPDTAFDTHQSVVNAALDSVREARRRRNFFCGAFGKQPDVAETVPSGSLARGTQRDPIHDVDLIIVFRQEDHPDWDTGSGSAEAALEYIRGQVTDLLSVTAGTFAREVRRAHLRNHVVKCFLDDPDDPDEFAVEVMPALRRPGAACGSPSGTTARAGSLPTPSSSSLRSQPGIGSGGPSRP